MQDNMPCTDDSLPPESATVSACARKLDEILKVWERAGVPYDNVLRSIDRCHLAASVVDRFRREQTDLVEAVAAAKSLDSEPAVHAYLEGLVRNWNLDEADAYRQLIVLAQGFLSTPTEPAGFGFWFRVIHEERWATILARTGLDEEGLFKFIRHVMEDDGLSAVDLYEKMIDLSDGTVSDAYHSAEVLSFAPDGDELPSGGEG